MLSSSRRLNWLERPAPRLFFPVSANTQRTNTAPTRNALPAKADKPTGGGSVAIVARFTAKCDNFGVAGLSGTIRPERRNSRHAHYNGMSLYSGLKRFCRQDHFTYRADKTLRRQTPRHIRTARNMGAVRRSTERLALLWKAMWPGTLRSISVPPLLLLITFS